MIGGGEEGIGARGWAGRAEGKEDEVNTERGQHKQGARVVPATPEMYKQTEKERDIDTDKGIDTDTGTDADTHIPAR